MSEYQENFSSPIFNTSDNYIKYQIEGINISSLYSNSSALKVRVIVFRSNYYEDTTPYKCVGYVRIDGTEYPAQVQNITGIPFEHNLKAWSNYDTSGIDIEHELDGTKTVKIDARFVLKDPTNDEVILDSGYQSYSRDLQTIKGESLVGWITMSLQYVTEQSVQIIAKATDSEDGTIPDAKPCAPYPIPEEYMGTIRYHYFHYWWYSIDRGETWIPYDYIMEDIYTPTGPHSWDYVCHTSTFRATILELSPNTTYNIIFAVYDPVQSIPTPPTTYPPSPEDADEEERFRHYRFSSIITVKTDPVIEPLPINPNDAGLFRRISIYEQDEETFESNGLGSMIDALSCKVTEEINGIFELEMEYPVDGLHFNEIELGRLLTANPNQYSRPQPFRIYNISKPHSGKVTVNAAHISYDLSFLTVAPFKAGSCQGVLAKMRYANGGSADVYHRFSFWTDIYDYTEMQTKTPMSIRSVLGGGDNSVLALYGGEFEFDGYNVKLWKQRGTDKGTVIRYGKNLTSLKQDSNCNNMFTAVRPYWFKETENEAEGGLVTCGIVHIDGVFDYTKILLLDMTSYFDDGVKPTQEELRSATIDYINYVALDQPIVSLQVSFVQLSDSLEYQDIKLLEEIKLGDYVTVQFPKLNIDAKGIECIKTVFNVLSQRYDSIDLGSPQPSLSSTISSNSQAINTAVSKIDNGQSSGGSGGESGVTVNQKYVITDYDTIPCRLLVMDEADKEDAHNVFQWSFDGLNHSSNGVNGPYTSILPMNGQSINIPTVNCTVLNQTTPSMTIKDHHILKQLRW